MQRATGEVRLEVTRSGLADLRQAGSLRAFLPRIHRLPAEAVLANTAGGLVSGDRFAVEVAAGEGAALVVTTQAAERAYRAEGPPATLSVRLCAAAGARLDWLPQETILYDGAGLRRTLMAEIAPDARLLVAEMLVFGRTAMGEALARGDISDQWRIRRGGTLLHAEALRLGGDLATLLARPGTAAGARAMATLLLVTEGAGDLLGPVRAALGTAPGITGGASAWDGRLVVRLLAGRPAALRALLAPLVATLRGGPLPRVWPV